MEMKTSFFNKLENISRKEYAPVPFWSWNNKIEIEECKRQIRQMKEVGFGGFIIHARAGLKTEYLSEDWFACVEACIEEAKAQDMCIWIYDEFGYPSGFVGGTLLNDENNLAEYLEYETKETFDENAFAVFVERNGEYQRIQSSVDADIYHTIYKRKSPCNVDILNPSVVDLFIEKTYEAYYKRFGKDFGGTIRGFFTDEPQYYRYATPYTCVLEKEFLEQHQENVKDGLIHLFGSQERDYSFRVKYYQTMNRLYTQNYYKRLYDWCMEHGCQLTGHTVEEPHLFSQMWGSAGAMPSYRYSHVPGIDHLCQAMDGVMDEVQVESVAMQFGAKQVMSESFACTGYDANFRTLKYIADYQYAQGVNYLVVHLMNYSLQGMGYKDHPQTFSSHATWWKDFALFNDYFTKLGYIFANTKRQVNVLLVHPMQDCYLTYDRKQDRESVIDTEEKFYTLSKELAGQGIAFHYADEMLLKENGKVQGNSISIGEKAYDYVILPNRKSINASTQNLLSEFVSLGGKLCVLGEYPKYTQGEKISKEIQSTFSYKDILLENAPMIKSDGKVFQRHCIGELGEFIFLLNTDEKAVSCQIPNGWACVDFEAKKIVDCARILSLQPKQSILLKGEKVGAGTILTEKTRSINVTEKFAVTAISDNNLLLDFARISFDGKEYSDKKFTEQILDELIRARYQGKIYLKYEFVASIVPEGLSLLTQNNRIENVVINGKEVELFATDYDSKFYKANLVGGCKVGKNEIVFCIDFYENPSVYYAIYGENVTESLYNMISYDTVIEPVFLQGQFNVNEDFNLTALNLPKQIWNIQKQGFPFFNGEISIEGIICCEGNEEIFLCLYGNYASAEIYINEHLQGVVALSESVSLSRLKKGENQVQILLKSTMRNMYGPHHCRGMQEDWPIARHIFTFFREWGDKKPDYFIEEYNLATFGIEKIQIEVK